MEGKHSYIRRLNIILLKLTRNRKELDFAEGHYYKINQILLSIIQLWPYDQSVYTSISRIFLLILLGSLLFFQFTTFLTYEYTIDFFIAVFSHIVINCICLTVYIFFYINSAKIRQIWKNIRTIWNDLDLDDNERKIMQHYSFIGELITIFLTLLVLLGFLGYTLLQFSPLILDLILPLRESRPHHVYALTEYFIDGDTYYYPLLCHWLLGLFIDGLITIATGSFMVVYMQHVCGLLRITCYRIRQSVNGYSLSNFENADRASLQGINDAVNMHRLALNYADFLMSTCVTMVMVILLMGTASVFLNMFAFLKAIISEDTSNILPEIMIFIGQFVVLFMTNYCGQQITDHNTEVFNNVYNARWYGTSTKMQKLLLFIMKKTTKNYFLNIGNILTASIETFAKLSKLAISYFTVIYSLME